MYTQTELRIRTSLRQTAYAPRTNINKISDAGNQSSERVTIPNRSAFR